MTNPANTERYTSFDLANQYWQECIEILGLESELVKIDNGLLSTYVCLLKKNGNYLDYYLGRGFGKGQGPQSELSAKFEALEHYLSYDAHLLNSNKYYFSIEELIKNGATYFQNDPEPFLYEAIGKHKKIHWLKYQSAIGNNEIHLPLAFSDPVFSETTETNEINYKDLSFLSTNNGVAIGCSPIEALIHGSLELVERDALSCFLIQTYLLKKPVNIIKNDSFSDQTQVLIKEVERITSDELIIYSLNSRFKIPAYGACLKNFRFVYPLFGYGASLITEHAIERAILECLQAYIVMPRYYSKKTLRNKLHLINDFPIFKEAAVGDIPKIIESGEVKWVEFNEQTNESLKNCAEQEYLNLLINQFSQYGTNLYYHKAAEFSNGVTLVKSYIPQLENFYAVLHHGYPALPNKDLSFYETLSE